MGDSDIQIGDYVLATKWGDGDPGDPWGLGFYAGFVDGRHFITGNDGLNIRAGGYRHVGRVTAEIGHWLLQNAQALEQSPPGTINLWTMLTDNARCPDAAEAPCDVEGR